MGCATISALETLDQCIGRLELAVRKAGGILAITSDHGNAEEKVDADGNVLTAHTTNPVPFVLVSEASLGATRAGRETRRYRNDAASASQSAGADRDDRDEPDLDRECRTREEKETR